MSSLARLRGSSGTYNVRASEMARDKQEKKIRCTVKFLDDTEQFFEVERKSMGETLMEEVCKYLDLLESDYFGLKFIEHENDDEYVRWLDPIKLTRKQVKGPPYYFFFRIKFFVMDPSKLHEEYTRYQYVLQLKRDILHGRLMCSLNKGALLASYSVQAELGDYDPMDHPPGYLVKHKFMPNQNDDFLRQVEGLHKQHMGQTPADAEFNYLDTAKRLDMYGVDLHYARDSNDVEIQLGIAAAGLVIFQNNLKINTFTWAKIVKLSFKRKQFFVQLKRDTKDSKEHLIGFNMASYRSCKSLWKSCVEHHTFFRLTEPRNNSRKKFFFSLGSKFRYSGRTEYQTQEEGKRRIANKEKEFASLGLRPLGHDPWSRQSLRFSHPFSDHSTPSKKFARSTIATSHDVAREQQKKQQAMGGGPYPLNQPINTNHKTYTAYDVRVPMSPQKACENGFSGGGSRHDEVFSPNVPPKMIYMDNDPSCHSLQEHSYEIQSATTSPYNGSDMVGTILSYIGSQPNGMSTQDLVVIRIKADSKGRFGFNVKGGADQSMPVIVSRVAPNTPADLCIPRLNEGDQVLLINSRDITKYSHEQVVSYIRSMKDTSARELILTVKPNVYEADSRDDEPAFQYIPDTPTQHVSTSVPDSDVLRESILLLKEGLETGAAVAQFDQLYRKKPAMMMNVSKAPDNVCKNRYRDVLPYDATRVRLQGNEGDYINANYVNMEIPTSGIINRYIAAQGPLPNTSGDFWQMVWQEQSTLVVMLTSKVERGRVKCHQYWPERGQAITYGSLQVICIKSDESAIFATREFNVTDLMTNEQLNVLQMQYIAWPDHGVPDESSDFLDFVFRVRQNRVGMAVPTVVHCSAGIGRTGVLITMETAMCLIESNEPVYPLDVVKAMRDQRGMMIQTPAQYQFVCQAIVRVYTDGIVKPLEEFQRQR